MTSHTIQLICCVSLFWSTVLSAQEPIIEIDIELWNQINIDSLRAHRVEALVNKNMEEALKLSDTIIAYTKHLEFGGSLQFNDALFLKADVFTKMSQWKNAQKLYEEILTNLSISNHEDSVFLSKIHFNRGLNFYNQSQYLDAITVYKESLDLRLKLMDYYSAEIGSCFHNLGSSYLSLGEFDQAIDHYLKALEIRKKVYGENHPEVAHPLQNLGNCYLSKRDYLLALDYNKKALNIRLSVFGENHQDVASNYNMLGICYYYLSDGHLARYYLEKSLNIRIGLFGTNSPNIVSSYMNLGGVCIQSLENNKARHYYLKALDIQKKVDGTAKERLYQIYSNLAASYFTVNDYPSALDHFMFSVQMAIELGINEEALVETYENIGTVHMNLMDFNSAILYFKKAETILIKLHSEKNKHLPMLYMYLAKSYVSLNQRDSMQFFIDKATEQLEMGVLSNVSFHSYCYQILGGIYISEKNYTNALEAYEKSLTVLGDIDTTAFNSETHVRLLNGLAKLNSIYYHFYKKDLNSEHKEKSLKYARECISQVNHFKKNLSDQDLLKFIDDYYFVYSNFLELYTDKMNESDLKQNANYLFTIAEELRSNEILVEFIKNTSLDDSSYPEESLQRLKEMSHQIVYLEKNLEQLSPLSEIDSNYIHLQSAIFDLKNQYDSLENLMLNDNPIRVTKDPDSIEDIMHCIEIDQSVITFNVLDKKLLVQLINREDHFIKTIALPENFEEQLSLFKSSLISYHLSPKKSDSLYNSSLENYINSSNSLYSILIKPFEIWLNKRVAIIPDATLANLPFSALLSNSPAKLSNFNTFPFLERKYQFSYGFSASILCHLKNKSSSSSTQKKVLAFAPFYKNVGEKALTTVEKRNQYLEKEILLKSDVFRDSLTQLPFSLDEVKEIAKIIPSDLYIGEYATTSVFLENYNKYQVLHLSTHGKANPDQTNMASLAFYPEPHDSGLLFSRNIYKLKNKASLVVLSGCETAGGFIIKGEGALSLSRAFVLSGSQSVLASLWLIDDLTTKDFMVNFYKALKTNKSIDHSVHLAKLNLLTQKNNAIKHPFFWAGYSCYGDTTLKLGLN